MTKHGEGQRRRFLIAVLATSIWYLPACSPEQRESEPAVNIQFTGARNEVERNLYHYENISLTTSQEERMQRALGPLSAPCCSDFSMATCCCECNLARSVWGLSKHLISERNLGEEAVRTAAVDWIEAINPRGFSGDVCATGGCGRSFMEGGCGGMTRKKPVIR